MGREYRRPGTVTMIPHASSPVRHFGDLSAEDLRKLTTDLTPEEKRSEVSKLYYQADVLTDEQKRIIGGPPMDPADAFEPEDYADNMNRPGHCKVENGFCVLPDGIAYSAVMIRQEGRTNEKMSLYNNEFGTEGALAYKCWCPGYHYFHYSDGAVEDFGYGLLNMKAMVDPNDNFGNGMDVTLLGIDIGKVPENDPSCIWQAGNYWKNYRVLEDRISGKPIDSLIVNYLRETDYGRELRIRMFAGVGICDGKLERTGLPEDLDAEKIARLHMRHLMLEYGNEARLVNQFWEIRHPGKAQS